MQNAQGNHRQATFIVYVLLSHGSAVMLQSHDGVKEVDVGEAREGDTDRVLILS